MSFSVNNNSGDPSNTAQRFPYVGLVQLDDRGRARTTPQIAASVRPAPTTTCCGTRPSAARASVAGSGPRFATVMRTRMSSTRRLCVLDEYIEIAIVVEHAGIEQFELGLASPALAVLLPLDACTGNSRLRVFVQDTSCRSAWACCRGSSSTPSHLRRGFLHCRSGRRAAPSGSDPAHSKERSRSRSSDAGPKCPQCRPRSSDMPSSAHDRAADTPMRSVLAIVLAHGAPCALAQIRSPALPVLCSIVRSFQA